MSGILIVFDLSNRKTFLQASVWINLIKEKGEKDVTMILVGNKRDLCTSEAVNFPILEEEPYEMIDSDN